MSTLATARRRAASGPARPAAWTGAGLLRISPDATLGLALAGGLTLIAFLTTGGVDLASNTWVEIVLTVLGAASAATVLVLAAPRLRSPGRPWGLATLLLFGALAALTFASIAWSVQPADSWIEANRTLSYVAAFGAAMALAMLLPARWPALIGAIAVVATVLSAWALVVKVFPATFAPADPLGRLHAPFDYWNATGVMAAIGLPACAWAGARPGHGAALRALSVPAVAILVAVLILSYSRGALAAAMIGLGFWFVLVPLRLRATLVLALGAAGGAAITLWALSTHAITHDHATLQARIPAGHAFGLVLLLVLALTTVAGFVAAFAADRVTLSARLRHRLGTALVTLVAMVPVGAVLAVSVSSRGLPDEVSHVWRSLTNPNSSVSDNPGRLAELGSSRPRYWSEGLKVGEHALLDGVGALGYATARTRYSNDPWIVTHAHSYVIETFADFGLIGVALSLALLIAWALAARRAVLASDGSPSGPAASGSAYSPERARNTYSPERARSAYSPERGGLLTLVAIVLVFGMDSAIDWTWFIPGAAVPAMICAGWLAGRSAVSKPDRSRRRRPLSACPGALAGVVGIGALALIVSWVIWQPLRSADADGSAITALTNGNTAAALSDARSAASSDPVSVDPLLELSAIDSAIGERAGARQELTKATSLQPSNPATWQALGSFDLDHHQPRLALMELRRALILDLSAAQIESLITQAQAQSRPA